jgi:hypothetical protein
MGLVHYLEETYGEHKQCLRKNAMRESSDTANFVHGAPLIH